MLFENKTGNLGNCVQRRPLDISVIFERFHYCRNVMQDGQRVIWTSVLLGTIH